MTKSVGGTGAVPSQILGQYLDKFRDDTAVVPPTYGRDRSQTSDSFGCPRSARCTDNCILNRLHERSEGDSGELGIARAADRRMARGENVAGGASLCLIIFIYFVRQPSQRPSLCYNGSSIGSHPRRATG